MSERPEHLVTYEGKDYFINPQCRVYEARNKLFYFHPDNELPELVLQAKMNWEREQAVKEAEHILGI